MLDDEPVRVLVVEDNENEQASIVEVLRSAIPDVQVVTFGTGTEALNFLFSRGDWRGRVGAPQLSLIILDLNLPGEDGFSVLSQIRSLSTEDALRLTPVVIFTDSRDAADVARGYRCGASSYIVKPLSFPHFKVVLTNLAQYWITYNKIFLSKEPKQMTIASPNSFPEDEARRGESLENEQSEGLA